MKVTKCNMCGKDFNEFDYASGLNISHIFNYPSKYDGCDKAVELNLDLCSDCLDKEVDHWIEVCEINPVDNWDEGEQY